MFDLSGNGTYTKMVCVYIIFFKVLKIINLGYNRTAFFQRVKYIAFR